MILAVNIFHNYLFGRNFTIANDYIPLWTLFNVNKGITQILSGRIHHRALALDIPLDLSRLPSKSFTHEIPPILQVMFGINNIEEKISVKEIIKYVALGQVLQKVMVIYKEGMSWQHRVLHLLHEGHPGMTRMKAVQTFKKAVGRTIGESCLKIKYNKKVLSTNKITPHTSTDLHFPSDPIVKKTISDARNGVRNQFKP